MRFRALARRARGVAESARPRLLLATRSEGKLRELTPLLAALGYDGESLAAAGVVALPEEEYVEAGETFEQNALAKARYFHARCDGRVVLAEDSGLCVDALGGGPGVRSKRWGGEVGASGESLDESNNARLLRVLSGVHARGAHYACSAALVWGGGELVADGMTMGRILEASCGAGGFGYDPLFWSTELDACFGAVSREQKAAVSHRGRAVEALLVQFSSVWGASLAGPVDPERGAM